MDTTNRSSGALNSLWEKLSDLKKLESDLADRISRTASAQTAEQIKSEIEIRLGFFPPHFIPALESPPLLQSLWHQYLTSYLNNPLPDLFKEKLSIRLSRFCISSYYLVLHACSLIQLGVEAGRVRQFIEEPSENTPADNEEACTFLTASVAKSFSFSPFPLFSPSPGTLGILGT